MILPERNDFFWQRHEPILESHDFCSAMFVIYSIYIYIHIIIYIYRTTGGSLDFIVNGEETAQFEDEVARVTQELVKHLGV